MANSNNADRHQSTPPKKVLKALEKVFGAEINDRLPFQSKATVYRDCKREQEMDDRLARLHDENTVLRRRLAYWIGHNGVAAVIAEANSQEQKP